MQNPERQIIELDITDSTNNYAMGLIDADKAYNGLTITALSQTAGRGQRGRTWVDEPGSSLLMSIIISPELPISAQFSYNATVAAAIADVLNGLDDTWQVRIKWPNDMIINDKKAGGILIENVLRGSRWANSIIGLGLNITQLSFSADLPHATSLRAASGREFQRTLVRDSIIDAVLAGVDEMTGTEDDMKAYNDYLYKRGCLQQFSDESGSWFATILGAHADGTIQLQHSDGTIASYAHGQIQWQW
jgi:BirA family transcriptional regulator, biotin operon repressor / biotin---[acetyl-CoA-carboxylase] ligase